MPAAMHLTVLVSLLAVALCSEITTITSSGTTAVSTSTAQVTSSSISSTVETPISIPQPQTTAQQSTTETTAQQSTTETTTHQNTISISSTSPQKPKRTEETDPSPPPQTTTINQTSNETALPTVSTLPASESPNITATTSINSTTTGFFPRQETGDLASNPGLVAIICIFCIVLTLALVVATLKCIQSPKSNFERLEDMPMGKVNEESPFAHYSK